METTACFSFDYHTARQKFLALCEQLGWDVESHPFGQLGAQGEELAIDVSTNRAAPGAPTLLLSSGLHGVEGFFGSAVQLAYLQKQRRLSAPLRKLRILCLHGLNPYGFSFLRRFDGENIDLNRNFLIDDGDFQKHNEAYGKLDRFLNPPQPPGSEHFHLQALRMILRDGYRALVQSIAGGQHQYPQGIFFGGRAPAQTRRVIQQHWARWLGSTKQVIHLDWHTGLGRWATHELLFDYPLTDWHRQVRDAITPSLKRTPPTESQPAYTTQGSWGDWCQHHRPDELRCYFYACAEFGTYRPMQILRGLRAENQAHHWGQASDRSTQQAKRRLAELFCPASASWRHTVVTHALQLIERSENYLIGPH